MYCAIHYFIRPNSCLITVGLRLRCRLFLQIDAEPENASHRVKCRPIDEIVDEMAAVKCFIVCRL